MSKIYIVEDEPRNLKTVEHILHIQFPAFEVKSAKDLHSAIQLFSVESPDLALLDIEYPDGNAFDLLRHIPIIDFNIVFISGYEKYALEAIKFSAIDYILKPLTEGDLVKAIKKGMEKSLNSKQMPRMVETLMANYSETQQVDRSIVLKTFDSIYIVKTCNVVYCTADNNYTTFYLDDKRKIMVSKPIKEFEGLLESFKFMRVHQSHLVNLAHINMFDKRDGGMLIMDNNAHVPVATRKKQLLMDYFSSLEK